MLDEFDDIRLRELVLFDRLVQLGTITAAAKELGLAKPTASRWLQVLEEKVGGPLVIRGARKVGLTEQGERFHKLLQPLLRGLRAAHAVARGDQPAGTLRVSVPVPLGRLVGGQVIAAFQRRLPAVRLEILLQNQRTDLHKDRVDLAIRGGPLPDSSLVARHLVTVPMWVYLSASCRHTPLAQVPLIAAPGDERELRGHHPELLPAAVVVDDRTAVRDALALGAGAGVLPAFLGEPLREQGALVRLGDTALSTTRVHAVFLPEQRRDLRIRTLIELVEEGIAGWSG